MPSKSKVYFFFEQKDTPLRNRSALKIFIEYLFKREKKKLGSVNYIFCSDKRLLQINREFLRHDYYTDIITFDLSEKGFVQAEIYISLDRVRDNARLLGISIKSELHRVIIHGALHLCGYNDKNPADVKKMRSREDYYLSQYFG
jgi:rRNA maturation RNase YbeY